MFPAPPDLLMTAEDLSAIYDVPVGTLQRWASLDGWDRTKYARPVRYAVADADRSFHKYRPRT
jgi:hypothetical protein